MTDTTPDYAGLLPCPHCGGIAAKHHRPQAGAVRIVCSECAAQTGWFSEAHGGSPDVAWNRRAPSDADNYIDQLNTLCEDFGCEPGSDRLHWLQEIRSAEEHSLISLAAKEIDKAWRSRKMVPACPHCKQGLFPEDFKNGVATRLGREYAEARRRRALEGDGRG